MKSDAFFKKFLTAEAFVFSDVTACRQMGPIDANKFGTIVLQSFG
jgi:hypothetical protein